MNATETSHAATPRPAGGPRPANGAHGSTSSAPASGKAAEGDAPADPFAALLDGLCLPEGDEAATQATATDALPEAAPATPAGKPGVAAAQPVTPDAFLAMLMPGAMAASAQARPGPLLAVDTASGASGPATATAGAHKQADAVPDLFVAAATDLAAKQAPAPSFGAVLAAAAGAAEKKHELRDAAAGPDLAGVGAVASQAGAPLLDATPAAPVHQAAIASHPLGPAFASDLGAEVQWMVDAGVQQADLHLNPADLGPIRIQLSLTAQTADISFAAAHGATREGITQALPALREMLSTQGLQLGQAGVSSGGQGGGQSFAQPERQRSPARVATGAVEAPRARSGSASLRPGRGILDLYA